jgi:hypothetical protein
LVDAGCSTVVAAQLANRFRASCVGGPGLGGVGEEALAGIRREWEGFEGQVKVSDDRVVETLYAGGVDPDMVGAPSAAELVAAGGELSDQVRQLPVVGIAAGLGSQQGDNVIGDLVPVACGSRRTNLALLGGLTGSA